MTVKDTVTTEYVMDSASDAGREQLQHLQVLFDPSTKSFLSDIGVWPGARCLDVGSGSGSITRWLADHVGRAGEVVSVEIDTDQLEVPPQVEVHRHDISVGLPVDGPFDLIHARLVLMHLSKREEILRTLSDALAPGGWLVLSESPNRPQEVLAAPSADDARLADRMIEAGLTVTGRAGVDWEWANTVDRHLVDVGLRDIRGFEYCPMITGGAAGALLMSTYVTQVEALLLDTGITEDEVTRFHELMRDPEFRAWPFMRLTTFAGRKPAAEGVQ